MPSLYCRLEASPLSSADFKPLEYVVVGAFMKIFNTMSKEVATSCMEMFNFPLPSMSISNIKSNFLSKLSVSDNINFVDSVLNMLTSIRPSIELCCLVVFDLSCNVLFCYFLPAIRGANWRSIYSTVCFFVYFLFVRSTISRQPAGRFTPKFACSTLVPDVSSPLLGVGGPRRAEKGANEIFVTMGVNREFVHFGGF